MSCSVRGHEDSTDRRSAAPHYSQLSDDVLLQGSSRKLTSFSVGLNTPTSFWGGRNTESGIHTGDAWFGAESDHGKRGDLPVNQFGNGR